MTLTIDYQTIIVFLCLFSLLFSSICCMLSVLAYAKVVGLQNSTHNVQYIPMDTTVDRQNEEFIKSHEEDEWATTEDVFKKEDDKYRKERDEFMPDFAVDEEDMKIHSF